MSDHCPQLSVVIAALDEQDNVGPLVDAVDRAMREANLDAELIIVDDGSTDATLSRLRELAAGRDWLRILHQPRTMGQSAAMHAGIQAARGPYIATLDADLQNDPADLPKMLQLLLDSDADLVQGDRSANRCDNMVRRVGSWVGRTTRRLILADPIRDTGCSARVIRAAIAKQLPLQYKGMHRFIPHCARMHGAKVIQMPVNHGPRHAGQTKYGYGVFNRGVPGLFDCLAVRWMSKRLRSTAAEPVDPPENAP